MKKVLVVVLSLLMVLSLVACGQKEEAKTGYVVGMCQIIQHPALDLASQGFKDALNEALPGEVTIKEGNAAGEIANCTTIINGYVSDKVDLILANATAPLQTAAGATSEIPILGTSITDYASALEISDWTGVTGKNISGTTDLAPLDEQAAMVKEWFPDAKNVGIIYCSSEANSVYQVNVITGYLKELGFAVKAYSFTDSNDVTSVTELACSESDVIYIPTDNTAAANTEAIANVVLVKKVPVIAGEEGIAGGCGVATLSIDYYDLGYATGKMAAKILKGEAKVGEVPVESATKFTKKYNKANCEALGLTVPEGYEAI